MRSPRLKTHHRPRPPSPSAAKCASLRGALPAIPGRASRVFLPVKYALRCSESQETPVSANIDGMLCEGECWNAPNIPS